ncbi:MAG: hypothetical protein IJT91_01435 [Clostridia bacterium]|nr:hypothetical protein [Clostridia bacterium]
MKKITALLLSVITLALCLTGCVYEEFGVKLNKDGTGSIETTVGLKKEFVTQLAELGGANPFAGKETAEIEYDGETYIAFTDNKEYESFEEMEKALSELTYDTNDMENAFVSQSDDGEVERNEDTNNESETVIAAAEAGKPMFKSVSIRKDGSTCVFDAVLNAADGTVEGYDLSDVLKVGISVEMPAKITKYKNGKVDGKKIVFDLSDMSGETELYVECKASSPVSAIIGIVLAVAAVAAFIVLRKRK